MDLRGNSSNHRVSRVQYRSSTIRSEKLFDMGVLYPTVQYNNGRIFGVEWSGYGILQYSYRNQSSSGTSPRLCM